MTDSAITFDIDSPAVARRFQSLLNAYYVSSRLSEEPSTVPADLFATVDTLSRTGRQDRRLLWAVIVFELTYLSMMRDIHGALDVWAGRFSPESPKPASVLDDSHAFAGKLDILYNMTSFALRCRAFWDKTMGILFLLYDDSNYQAFAQSASRKRFFRKRAGSWPSLSSHLLKSLEKVDVVDLAAQPGLPDLAISPPHRPSAASNPPFHEHLPQIIDCSAPGFLDSGLKVITSTRPRPARRNRVALGLDSDSRTSPASTVRCTSA